MTSTNQKINNLESAVSDLQTKSYGIRFASGVGVETFSPDDTIPFPSVEHSINIDTNTFANGFKITIAGFYSLGYALELYGNINTQGGVIIERQSGYLYVSGSTDTIAENVATIAYLNVGDEIKCRVWAGSLTMNQGYGRRMFWIHSI
jgi:hypothetical protein